MVWRCDECNIIFENQKLYDTHKKKFCVGSAADPARIHSRISKKSEDWKGRKDRQALSTPLPDIRTQSSLSAPNTPSRTLHALQDGNQNTQLHKSYHQTYHRSAPNTPSDGRSISALEKEKIEQLKMFKMHQQLQRNSKNFEEKLLLNSLKDEQRHSPRRFNEGNRGDDRILQLTEIHRQQLAELKQRNEKLQEEKAKLAERMNSLGLKSQQRIPSQGFLDKQAVELDGLKRYLDFKEDEEKRKFNAQQSKVNLLKVTAKSPPHSAASAASKSPEPRKPRQFSRPESERYGRGQVIPYYQSPVRYYDAAPIQLEQSSVLHELNMLKNDYFQKGGHDPAILAQIRDLEFEAQRMQAVQRPAPPPTTDPLLQQQIMSFHMANQRLEQELQMLREERNQKDRMRSPDLDPEFKRIKEEHLVKMASLRQEAELLRQQAEVEKMRRELKELRGEKLPLDETRKPFESPFMMSNATTEKDLLPSPYDPNAGFTVYWDFVLGLSSSLSSCRLAAGVYKGVEIATDVKLLPLVRTTAITKESHPTIPSGGVGVVGVKHPFPRCLPDQDLCLVVELQANSAEDSNDPTELFSKGWTKIDLFDISNRLLSGRWKIPIRIAPIKAFLSTHELNKIPQIGQAELYIRLVNSRDVTSQDALNAQPIQHYMYKYPALENIRVARHIRHSSPQQVDFTPAPPPSVPPPPDTPVSAIQRVESAPRTPIEDSVVGFQVDKLVNAIRGESRIKITVYEHDQGQVIKGDNDRPVMCITKAAKQDFLEGIYSFGLQEAQFKNVPWDANSIMVFRVYIQPGDSSASGSSTAQTGNIVDESKLAAWTAVPLALTAGSHVSRQSRQSGGSRGGSARLNVGTHNLPLFFPPVVEVPNIPLRGPFPEQWSPYGEASLRISIFTSVDFPPDRPSSPEEFVQENDLPENIWIKNGRPSILTDEFEEGNGIDLYIDGARFLPDSVTVSKVAGRVLDKNYTRIGTDIDVQAELDSDIYNPEYNARIEYRDPVFPPSCTLMLKVYTVDKVSKNLCCVGYGFLPIFIEVGTTIQPPVSKSEVKVALNEGAHQIRLYSGSPDLTQPLHESLTQSLSPVPCASLLIRIVQAACHPNGRPKEASEFNESEWESEGVFQPKSSYADGEYYSLSCEPTLGESQIFHSMVKRNIIRTRDAIKFIGDGQEQKLKKDRLIESWIKTRLTRNIDTLPGDLDLSYVALYHVTHGLKISVDAAQNLPWNNFTMATYCLSPPGSFYKGAREDPLNFVTRSLFSSSVASPVWREGPKVFPRRIYHRFMVIIIHLHELVVDSSQSKTTFSLQGQAWSAVQVFNEGYVMGGSFQLPLYAGDPPEVVVNSLRTDSCVNVLASFRRRKMIKYLEGSSIFVRLADARRMEELPAPKVKARHDYLPREKLDRYLNTNPSSSLSSLVPRGMTEDELTAEFTRKFESLTNQLIESYEKGTS
ncbi:Coiled-coil domain-containing protein 17 [Porites harrisoni]